MAADDEKPHPALFLLRFGTALVLQFDNQCL
jgi:hypothetical protein